MCPVYQRGQAVWHANGLGAETKPAEHVRAHQHRPGRLVPERKQDRGSLGCAGARHFHSFVHFCHAGNRTHSLPHKWVLHKRSGKEPYPSPPGISEAATSRESQQPFKRTHPHVPVLAQIGETEAPIGSPQRSLDSTTGLFDSTWPDCVVHKTPTLPLHSSDINHLSGLCLCFFVCNMGQ